MLWKHFLRRRIYNCRFFRNLPRPRKQRGVQYAARRNKLKRTMENTQTNNLISSAMLYRLSKDVDFINKGIEENKEVAKDEKDNIFKKFGKSVSNSVKKTRTESLEKALAKDQEAIKALGEGLLSGDAFLKEAKKTLDNQAKKTAFGLLYLLSDANEYDSKEETLSALSEALYGSKEALSTLDKELDADFRIISESLFSSIKSNDLIKEALNGYLGILSAPRDEKCALCMAKAVLGEDSKPAPILAILLAGKNALPYCNDEEKAKEAFLGIDKDSYFAAMAIKSVLTQEEKKEWNDDEKKTNLKGILTIMSQLNLLVQISSIVDKKDPEGAKIKTKAINGFVNRLADLNK